MGDVDRDYSLKLIDIAEEDLNTARLLLEKGYYAQAIFYTEQACEKLVKAVFIEFRVLNREGIKKEIGHYIFEKGVEIFVKHEEDLVSKLRYEYINLVFNILKSIEHLEKLRDSYKVEIDIEKLRKELLNKHNEIINDINELENNIHKFRSIYNELEKEFNDKILEGLALSNCEQLSLKEVIEHIRDLKLNDIIDLNRALQKVDSLIRGGCANIYNLVKRYILNPLSKKLEKRSRRFELKRINEIESKLNSLVSYILEKADNVIKKIPIILQATYIYALLIIFMRFFERYVSKVRYDYTSKELEKGCLLEIARICLDKLHEGNAINIMKGFIEAYRDIQKFLLEISQKLNEFSTSIEQVSKTT